MKTFIKLFLMLSLAAPLWAADDVKIVASRITDVTVYADRAQVTRTAVNVPLGGRLAFEKLPGWIDEGSVRVSLIPPDAGELVDVQIEKTFLARPEDEEIRKAEQAVVEIRDQLTNSMTKRPCSTRRPGSWTRSAHSRWTNCRRTPPCARSKSRNTAAW
jgi:hypothetical protein